MSECVLRMNLRENCLDCDLHQIVYGESYADTDVYCFKEKRCVGKRFGPTKDLARPDWCPIVCALPEGHGPLVDVDVIRNELKKSYHDVIRNEFRKHHYTLKQIKAGIPRLDNIAEGVYEAFLILRNPLHTIVPAERTGSPKDCCIPTEPPARHAAGQTEV